MPNFLKLTDIPLQIKRYSGPRLTQARDNTMMLCAMKLFFCLLGLVLVLEGLPYFAFPDKMKLWMKKIQETPDSQLRVMGFVAMCAGLALAYVFR